jgi:hypothetical protein
MELFHNEIISFSSIIGKKATAVVGEVFTALSIDLRRFS